MRLDREDGFEFENVFEFRFEFEFEFKTFDSERSEIPEIPEKDDASKSERSEIPGVSEGVDFSRESGFKFESELEIEFESWESFSDEDVEHVATVSSEKEQSSSS